MMGVHMNDCTIKHNLTYAYWILSKLGWDDHTYTHLSARSSEHNSFYMYPFGLRFEEVEPGTLARISLERDILEGQEKILNTTGYLIHGSIYKKRPDIKAIFHIHTPEIVAVSAYQEGLLPISQWALHFYDRLSYHDYGSLVLDVSQGAKMLDDLGQNYTMLLKHHGSLTCGRTIEEAMFYTYHLQKACQTQCLIQSALGSFEIPSKEVCQKASRDLLSFEKNLGERDWGAWVRWVECQR